MELNKSLNDSTCVGKISPYYSQLHSSSKDINGRTVTTGSCADSGYHTLSNAGNSDIYSSNATYAKNSNQEVTTMQVNDTREKNFQNSFTTHQDSNVIPRSAIYTSPLSVGHVHSHHPGPYVHAQDSNSANLDGNANHIHTSSDKFYDLHCMQLCKKNIYDICTGTCANYFQSTVSNINTNNNEKTLSCQVMGCDCQKKTDQHHPVKSHLFNGDNMTHSNSDFKSDASDLAEKIEFCLLFGYTVNQIRLAIFKLGYKASKNDILAELSSMQNVRPSSVGDLSSPDASTESSQGDSTDQLGELICKGADLGVESEVLHSHGALILDEENKDNEVVKDADGDSKNLRPIVIDGSNVAMSHGNKQYFSCKGILLAVNYFRNRDHNDITVFVPIYRKEASRHDTPIRDREILTELEKERILVFTPSRNINGKRVTCYDDRFILKLAQETDAVVVSNDNFRDLQNERPEWKTLVEKRLLMYSFVNDRFMPPDDPLGRNGPNIDNFLRIRPASEEQSKPQCPYGKKCTYGKKCKYFHPECPRPISERIVGKKSDNNRKKSKFSLALAAELIKRTEQHNTPSTSASSSCHQDLSMENVTPSLHFACSQSSIDSRVPKELATSTNESHPGNKMSTHPNGSNGECLRNVMLTQRSMQEAAHTHRCYSKNIDNLTEPFRQMSMSNHDVIQQNAPMCCRGHSNVHVCYEPNCQRQQFVGDKSRIAPNHVSGHRPDAGPPEFHAEHQRAKQNFQRSSPANLQQGHGVRSNGNSIIQQHYNVPNPYQVNPSLPAHFALPAYALYQSRYVDPHYPSNHPHPSPSQPAMHSYPVPPHSQGPPPVHPHYVGTPLYVAPVNTSTGSNNSLSRSFPYIPVQERIVDAASLPHNYGSSSSHSDPHGYSIRPSGLSSGLQQGIDLTSPHHSHLIHTSNQHISSEPPLSSDKNPRYYLYRNLCGLFQRRVVEAVMKAHPDIKEPKKIINLIQQMIE